MHIVVQKLRSKRPQGKPLPFPVKAVALQWFSGKQLALKLHDLNAWKANVLFNYYERCSRSQANSTWSTTVIHVQLRMHK